MSQSTKYLTVSEMLDLALCDTRSRGHSVGVAVEMIAEFFGISVSRVKKFVYYGDECSPQERQRIHQRYLDHMHAQQDHLTRQVEAVRQRLQRELNYAVAARTAPSLHSNSRRLVPGVSHAAHR